MTGRLAVLASGGGTNLQALLDAVADGRLDARVVVVVSDRPEAGALRRAEAAGVAAIASPVGGRPRRDYDADLAREVASHRPDLVVLAGWMRLLSSAFLDHVGSPVVNLHPAKPGTFPGLHAIERAFEAWQAGQLDEGGAMVHLVPDERVDAGPVLAWRPVPFLPGDTLAAFEARVHATERALLVHAVAAALAAPAGTLGATTEEDRR